ncbi:hypothetical protein MMC17_006409 [Xylographa soralifera]|nr:hypothetical protein [Xylographa soralifera]
MQNEELHDCHASTSLLNELELEKQPTNHDPPPSTLFSRLLALLYSPARLAIATALIVFFNIIITLTLTHTRPLFSSLRPDRTGPSPSFLRPLCGSSPSEALALNCTWISLINCWLPSACTDPSVLAPAEFSSGPLAENATHDASTIPLYWDSAFTIPATLADVQKAAFANGEEDSNVMLYTVYDYHRAHCMYLWRLSTVAFERVAKGEKGVGVFFKGASQEHTEHCVEAVYEYKEQGGMRNEIVPGVGRCVGLDAEWDRKYGWGGRARRLEP